MGKFGEWYKTIFTDYADPRTENYYLIPSPLPLIGITIAYFLLVLVVLPKFMQNRAAFKLKRTLFVYNVFQIILSTYMFKEAMFGFYMSPDTSILCEPVDYTVTPRTNRIIFGVYIYFAMKLIELSETCMFVLRKKTNQVTFLHLYHHASMPIFTWLIVKYANGGQAVFLGMINSFVHMVMYVYYLLAALGPQYQKYLWWKKYMTTMQLVQFVAGLVHQFLPLVFNCGYPKVICYCFMANAAFLFYLFYDFYKTSYKNNKKTKSA